MRFAKNYPSSNCKVVSWKVKRERRSRTELCFLLLHIVKKGSSFEIRIILLLSSFYKRFAFKNMFDCFALVYPFDIDRILLFNGLRTSFFLHRCIKMRRVWQKIWLGLYVMIKFWYNTTWMQKDVGFCRTYFWRESWCR